MPIGIFANALALLAGSIFGYTFRKYIPTQIITKLTILIGYISIALGIILTIKTATLAVLIFSLLLGFLLGDTLQIESKVHLLLRTIKPKFDRIFPQNSAPPEQSEQLISLIVLFCFGSTGIIGALTEGFTGNPNLMLAKSVLEIFTATIFSASLGIIVGAIAIPQFIFFMILYSLANFLMPFVSTPIVLNDFIGCGGVILLITGFRILEIKQFPILNLTPALIIVIPLSIFWNTYIFPLLTN
jgi:uncharacterized membrane protein YqgA involved in biofilm formation